MRTSNYNFDIDKHSLIKPVVIIRSGDHNIDTIKITLSNQGDPVDLTNAKVTFMGTTPARNKIIDDVHIKIVDAKKGVFEYTFPSAAGSSVGEYQDAYFSITLGNGRTSTMNFRIHVLSGVDISAPAASDYVSQYNTTVSNLNSAYDSAATATNDKMAATVSSLATSAANVLDSAVARINDVDSKANSTSSAASNAVSMASSVASAVTSQASYFNSVASSTASDASSVASSAVSKINSAASSAASYMAAINDAQFVHKTGDETIDGNKTFTSTINGNAATATKWQTAHTLALTGDVTGSVSIDGSNNVSMTTTGADLVHKTSDETIDGDKTFTGNTTVSGIKSSNIKTASTNLGDDMTINFRETAVGVNVFMDGTWRGEFGMGDGYVDGGSIPTSISNPRQNVVLTIVGNSGVGGISTNSPFKLEVLITTDGKIKYRSKSLRENDRASYTVTILGAASNFYLLD